MRTVQTKFFEILEERAGDAGFEVVVDYSASNVGRIHLQAEGTFETAASVGFNFQSGYPCVHFDGLGKIRPFPTRPNPSFAGFNADELDEAVDAIVAAGKGGR